MTTARIQEQETALGLRQVSFGYGAHPVLDAVSFNVRAGELLAIVGPNGCGKSTILKLMAGLIRPSAGEVLLDDLPVASIPRRKLARRLTLLAQSNEAPEAMLVRDLVGLGRFSHEGWLRRDTPEDRRHIDGAMRRMDVEALADRRVGELSGGQLQRCRMAMTLAQDADILLLDEPTNHLDLKHQYALLEVARTQALAGRAVVAVLHDLTHASLHADRIILMSEGRIAAEGSPADVLTVEMMEAVYGIRTVAMPFGRAIVHLPEGALR
ncbi:ABC transporter ATP-binding protein [Neorhizobium alkalisoli]|uniref:Iron complex transport system ATP-binding protein n=1 Tax=Neorhizobium alkalisoli TaxID=528178 RepID=A0A561R8Y8_9HYPH|nr:ABC transporter ATP-binding protein [Neorhizobium alkalisoli]TWF59068.1 iron complex transport system ATP-binding protein [Neorhizobium alkalisoli]